MRGVGETALRALAATALIVALWQGIIWAGDLKPFLLPGPLRVLDTAWDNRGLLAYHAGITLAEVLIGLVLGVALGAGTAIWLAASPRARYLVQPVLVVTQALPVFALAPILTLWLGFGIASKVVVALLIIYFPVTSSFLQGLLSTPSGWVDLARTMGADTPRLMWRVRIPAAVPELASGLRLAAVYAPIGAVIGEWVGSSGGLGFLMLLANGRAKTDLMFAALLVLAVLTVVLHRLVGSACDRLQKRFE